MAATPTSSVACAANGTGAPPRKRVPCGLTSATCGGTASAVTVKTVVVDA